MRWVLVAVVLAGTLIAASWIVGGDSATCTTLSEQDLGQIHGSGNGYCVGSAYQCITDSLSCDGWTTSCEEHFDDQPITGTSWKECIAASSQYDCQPSEMEPCLWVYRCAWDPELAECVPGEIAWEKVEYAYPPTAIAGNPCPV